MAVVATALLAVGLTVGAPLMRTNRTVLFWMEPYANLTTQAEYETAWAQFGASSHKSQYAAKVNGSLGYADTAAGEGNEGVLMEQFGFPALKKLGLKTIAMVYVTHFAAISKIIANPEPFIAQLMAKATDVGLDGYDVDYEPQENEKAMWAALDPNDFMAFLTKLAAATKSRGLMLTIDIGGCPQFNAFSCSITSPSGLDQVNTMSTFGTRTVQDFKELAGANAKALGERWAPGFEPNNPGQANFGKILQEAAAMGARRIATWEVHECNVGPQPQWLFDAVDGFLDAP